MGFFDFFFSKLNDSLLAGSNLFNTCAEVLERLPREVAPSRSFQPRQAWSVRREARSRISLVRLEVSFAKRFPRQAWSICRQVWSSPREAWSSPREAWSQLLEVASGTCLERQVASRGKLPREVNCLEMPPCEAILYKRTGASSGSILCWRWRIMCLGAPICKKWITDVKSI